MNETGASGLVQILEGAILAADHPLTVAQMANLFEEHERPETAQIREALTEVAQRCDGRGFELQEVASGFRFQVRQNLGPWVARLWVERPARYSRALLETLALIAYRQPITRGEIEEVRGVAVSSNIIKTLQEREWIRVVGHRDVPGRPAMYATTRSFLDYFNLKSLDQLPALAEIRDLETLTAELGFEPLPEESAAAESDTGEGHEGAVADGGGAEAAAAMTSLEQDAPGGAEDGAAGDAVAGIEDDEADATRGEDGAIDQGGHRADDDQNSAADASDEAGDEALAATTVEGADTDDSRGESELSIDALRKAAEAAGETAGPAGDDAQGGEHG